MKRRFYVYVYYDPRPNKSMVPIYVGKGRIGTNRHSSHWRNGTHNPLLANVLKKIAKQGLKPIYEIVRRFHSEEEALSHECKLIAKYGRRNIQTGTLCNLTDGGEGVSGLVFSKEAREKLSRAHTGHIVTEKTRRKISNTKTGVKRPAWVVAKFAKALKGRTFSDEHKANISKGISGEKNPFYGRTHSKETRDRLSAMATGRKRSEESRRKQSETMRAKRLAAASSK